MTNNTSDLVTITDIVREALTVRRDIDRLYWRDIANLDEYKGIPAGTLCSIYKGNPIPKKWYKRFGIPEMGEAPKCHVHGIVHCYDCETEQVKPRRNGTAPARKRTPPIRIGEATDDELEAIKQHLTTDERREALVEAANKKRRS